MSEVLDLRAQNDAELGRAAELLVEDGHDQAAALLLDVKVLDYRWWEHDSYTAYLEVDHWVVDRFTDEVRGQIQEALNEATREQTEFHVTDVQPRRSLPDPEGWRDRVERTLKGETRTNHARVVPLPKRNDEQDGLLFRSRAELDVYRILKRKQEAAAGGDGLMILPNTAARVSGHTFEIDFLVSYRGRAGVIEVDGTAHRGRVASDRSRDRLLEDAGIARVDRINAEDTGDPQEVERFVERFLRLLASDR